MFSFLRLTALAALLSCGISLPVGAAAPVAGQFAEQQLRHIATWFPGRMAGSPAEMLTADYLQQLFAEMGYQSDKRNFNTKAPWRGNDGKTHWRNLTATSIPGVRSVKPRRRKTSAGYVCRARMITHRVWASCWSWRSS